MEVKRKLSDRLADLFDDGFTGNDCYDDREEKHVEIEVNNNTYEFRAYDVDDYENIKSAMRQSNSDYDKRSFAYDYFMIELSDTRSGQQAIYWYLK